MPGGWRPPGGTKAEGRPGAGGGNGGNGGAGESIRTVKAQQYAHGGLQSRFAPVLQDQLPLLVVQVVLGEPYVEQLIRRHLQRIADGGEDVRIGPVQAGIT